jgi:hypothetical protein
VLTVTDLRAGKKPSMPAAYLPYVKADTYVPDAPKLPGFI